MRSLGAEIKCHYGIKCRWIKFLSFGTLYLTVQIARCIPCQARKGSAWNVTGIDFGNALSLIVQFIRIKRSTSLDISLTNVSTFSDDQHKCSSATHHPLPFHGIRLYDQVDHSQRLLWSFTLCLVTMTALFYTYYVLEEYLSYQTITHLTVRQNDSLLLPSIHVCPKNPDHFNYDVLFADIEQRVGPLAFELKRDILLYYIASCGFINTLVETWSPTRISIVQTLFDQWVGGRSMEEMFHFVFDENGLRCEDVFSDCVMTKCCDHFRPHYVMLRGRCMRLDNYYQTSGGQSSALQMNFKKPNSLLIDGTQQRQYVIYFGDEWPEIAIFPRIYVTKDELVLANVQLRKVKMMPRRDVCSTDKYRRGRATCYVNRWLEENLLRPLNCTLPSMTDLRSAKGYEVCNAHVVVKNYRQIITANTLRNRCEPNCDRWDRGFQYWSSVEKILGAFRLDVFYGDLSYEEYEEIAMLSYPGFISQIGGQLGLFLGVSIISFITVLRHFSSKAIVFVNKQLR